MEKLKLNSLHELEFKEDCISCKIEVSGNKILMLSIPYEKGWTAYVDGKKQNILKCNIMFSALKLSQGSHTIVLKYKTPGMALGNLISVCALVISLFIFMQNKKKFIKFNKVNKE